MVTRLHVLMVTEFPPHHGGVSDYAMDLAQSLAIEGVDLSVLTFAEPNLRVTEDVAHGIRVHRSIVSGIRSGTKSIGLAKEVNPDLIHIQMTTFLFNRSFYIFPLLYDSAPLLVTAHDVPNSYRTIHMIPFIRATLEKSRKIISLSGHVRDMLVGFHRVTPAKIVCIPLAVDLARFSPRSRSPETRKQLGWDGRFVVLLSGFLNPGKGVHTLVRAAALAGIPNLLVVVAGEFWKHSSPSLNRGYMGSYERFVQSEIARLGIRKSVEIRGYVHPDELPLLMANCDAFVLPYAYTYQSLSLHKAMASGSAIVASDVPGFREFIADGKTGLLTRVGNPGDLASKLRWIYDNPGDAGGLGANARRLAEERFDLSATAHAHLNIYRDIIRARDG